MGLFGIENGDLYLSNVKGSYFIPIPKNLLRRAEARIKTAKKNF